MDTPNPIGLVDPFGLIGGEFVNHMKTGGEPLGDDGALIALGILNLGLALASDGTSVAAIPSTLYVASRNPQNLNSSCPAHAAAELGNKLNYLFGQAGGNAHNVTRSTDMARQLASIGFQNTPELECKLLNT